MISILKKPVRTLAVVAVVLGMFPAAASAQDRSRAEDARRFQLFAKCRPLFPTVTLEQTSPNLEDLEAADLEQVVVAGLESARLMSEEDAPPFLFVTVGVVRWAFLVRVELKKELRDPSTDLRGGATTWSAHRYGIHSGDKSFVLSSLGTALEGFVDEYRRVNERDCLSEADAPAPLSEPGTRGPWTEAPRGSSSSVHRL